MSNVSLMNVCGGLLYVNKITIYQYKAITNHSIHKKSSFNQIAIVTPWKLGLLRLKWYEYQPFYVNINELIDNDRTIII